MAQDTKVVELDPTSLANLMAGLTKDLQFVELQPERLINNGHTMRLIPARDNIPMRGDLTKWDTLPMLDLATSGIEADRRTDTIEANVRHLLDGRRFRIQANFNLPAILSVLPEVGEMLEMQAFAWALRESHPFMDPNPHGVDQTLNDLVKDLQAGFTLEAQGPDIPGLDISKPVTGFIGNIAQFVLPFEELDQDGAEFKALKKAIDFYYVQMKFCGAARNYQDYLSANQQKWWFKFWNKKRKWEKAVAKWSAKLPERQKEFEGAISALPV